MVAVTYETKCSSVEGLEVSTGLCCFIAQLRDSHHPAAPLGTSHLEKETLFLGHHLVN